MACPLTTYYQLVMLLMLMLTSKYLLDSLLRLHDFFTTVDMLALAMVLSFKGHSLHVSLKELLL
jgi:hypothetical protein